MDKVNVKTLFLLMAMLLCPLLCQSQMQIDSIDDSRGPYWTKWDAGQEKLIAYRNANDASVWSAQIYNADGHSLPIYAVRDLAESHAFNVLDAGATPEGGVILAGLVEYGTAATHFPIKSVLVTYDAVGHLEKVWDVSPYEFDLVVVDTKGNVFAIGDANLDEPYFLLVKYSPEGKVIRQFLSTDQFPSGHHILSPGGGTKGLNQMFIKGDVLFVWFARTTELLRFSLAGDLLSRVSFAHALGQFAATTGHDGIVMRSIAPGDGNQLVAQVVTWDTQKPQATATAHLVQFALDGSSATPLTIGVDKTQFLGRASAGKLLVFEPSTGSIKEY